ncbi:hypothetical protein PANT_20c00051 [Moesziomyces antarcticus T-34]|uniref:Flavin reductase like domain-containing protein n=1 Tax=Pseudozyma antarctica (strain T-34) TaxID=1151754 RepID=M9M6D6_PSEA3|nr:hypothetical protein PANT_20c00051 [Moesziomyces antarcticus T-34]
MASARASTSRLTLEAFRPRRHLRLALVPRRTFSSCVPLSSSGSASDTTVSHRIRALMRESAQPVALITTLLPASLDGGRRVHAATLSSFTSVSLEPNVVCFSMRTPSKLAAALDAHLCSRTDRNQVDFVVSVLGEGQADVAAAYAKPGTPPLEELSAEEHPLHKAGLLDLQLGQDAPPALKKSLGAFACQVVDTVPLAQYAHTPGSAQPSSVLYLARVLHVHLPTDMHPKPLIYRHQQFTTPS